MIFYKLLYLHQLVKCSCRCLFQNCCIYISLLNTLVDAFFRTVVSASAYKAPLQMLFSVNMREFSSATCFFSTCRYSPLKICILKLPFLYLADTPLQNFASSNCLFSILQILPFKNLHPQLAFPIACRYFACLIQKISSRNLLFLLVLNSKFNI